METLTMVNGNGQGFTRTLPKLVIMAQFNDTAIDHIRIETGLHFSTGGSYMEAQPQTSEQIVKLLLTYNFKTRYYDNWESKNTLYLKPDHHVGFQVDSICLDCCKHNNIHTNGLTAGDRLAC